MSQDTLAESVGLTFQQIQKYERGANRVSASMLYDIGRTLGMEPGEFFEGLPEVRSGQPDRPPDVPPPLDKLGERMVSVWPRLSPNTRKALVDMAHQLAAPETTGQGEDLVAVQVSASRPGPAEPKGSARPAK